MSAVVVSSMMRITHRTFSKVDNRPRDNASTPYLPRNPTPRGGANDPQREEIIEAWRTIIEIEEDAKIDDFREISGIPAGTEY